MFLDCACEAVKVAIQSNNIQIYSLIVNSIILIVYAIMACFMLIGLKEGRQQSRVIASTNKYSLYEKELQNLINEAKNIEFKTTLHESNQYYSKAKKLYSNGNGLLYYEPLVALKVIKDMEQSEELESFKLDFKHSVFSVLLRYYDKLESYLKRVESDLIISEEKKNILYHYVERDILYDSYLRICNNPHDIYSLSILKIDFDLSLFYKVNNFYINRQPKNLLSYKDLEFYQNTLI